MNQEPHDLSQFSMLDLFRMEAEGQAATLTAGLLALEHGAPDAATLESLMRAAHSLKGAAAIVGLESAVRLAHAMEDAFVAAQRGALALGPTRVDPLLAAVDLMLQLASASGGDAAASDAGHASAIDAAVAAIRAFGQEPEHAPAAPAHAAPPATAEALPLAAPNRPAAPAETAGDDLLALAGQARLQALQLQPWIASLQRFKRQQAGLLAALEELHQAVTASGDPRLLEKSAAALARAQPLKPMLHRHLNQVEDYELRASSAATRLVDEVLALRMGRFGERVAPFPRMVRDLARSLGKQARLELAGADTLVDRATLARIEGPINQLLRNALDHGMETPGERAAAGKPALGTIRLEARHRGGMLAIEVADDGRGVNPERIRAAAAARGLVNPAMASALSEAELMDFLFLPGFSLKESANELSGRGVGLDVVHDAVREQNGSVRAESQPGRGFRTLITLPLTQSIVRALVVDVQGEAWALPIARVERVLKLDAGQVETLAGRQFCTLGGEQVGLVSAAQALGLGAPAAGPELTLVVIGAGRERYALVVDAVRGEQSLTVQPLEPIFGKLRDVAAGALLDDGAPVLILDIPDLLQSIGKLLGEGTLGQLARPGGQARAARRILVVDDSLTVREMERKLLAGRGYRVDVALDGMDGWNMVRGGDYDLVVSDIDMPRMDGIELVEMIRRDPRLHRLPVMIVSYKDRPEDRARGLRAGADYYLAKSSFHDATLLDAVFELIGPAQE